MSRQLVVLALLVATSSPPTLLAQEDPPSLETLLEQATSKVSEQRGEIEAAVRRAVDLFERRPQRNSRIEDSEIEASRAAIAQMGPAALPELFTAFARIEAPYPLEQLSLTIAAIGSEQATERLTQLVGSEEAPRAAAALRTLGRLGDDSARETVLGATADRPDPVRAEAVLALARLGDAESLEVIRKAAGDGDDAVRRAGVRGLGLLGRSTDVDLVASRVADRRPEVGLEAIRSLGEIGARTGSTKAMLALHEALAHEDPAFVLEAIGVVERIGNLEMSRRHLRSVVDSLGGRDEPLEVEGVDVRKRAAVALHRMGDAYGLEELARPIKAEIRRRGPRRARDEYRSLSDLCWEFRDYKACIEPTTKALDGENMLVRRVDLQVRLARCYARLGKFSRAANWLEKALGTASWPHLADDPDFAEMRRDRRYRKAFQAD